MSSATSIADILGPLARVLDEADVVEISVNADQAVWVERFGAGPVLWGTMETGRTERFVRWCATWSQASIMEDSPILSGRVPGTAHRIEALIPPVVEAPAFSIRRHREQVISLAQFLGGKNRSADEGLDVPAETREMAATGVDASPGPDADTGGKRESSADNGGNVSSEPVLAEGSAAAQGASDSASADATTGSQADKTPPQIDGCAVGAGAEIAHLILSAAIADRRNILIAGATGSGKTTLLNACLDHLGRIAPQTRLITIEDTPEIRVPLENTLALRSSPQVSMDRLLVSTLRLAPDRIVVGEVREGAVLMTLVKAWDTGHPGGLTTLHANSAAEVLPRLKMLATEVMASDPTGRLMQSLDMIVFLRRGRERPVVETIIAMNRASGPAEPGVWSPGGPGVGERTMEVVYSHET